MSYNLPNQIIDASGNYINIDNSGIYIYNSGIGTADYERFGIHNVANRFNLGTEKGGAGTDKDLYILRGGASQIEFRLGGIQVIRMLLPNTDGDPNIGRTDLRFGTIYGQYIDAESHNAGSVPLTVMGAVSQNANLTEWKNSADEVVASIDASGDMNIHNLVADNFTVSGTFTYLNNENVTILDKQLELASDSGVAISGDAEVDQGGIVIKSTDGDKKWLWDNSSNTWKSNVGISCTGDINIDVGNITLDSNRFIEWVGSNNRVRGQSGGVGGGRIELIAGSYNVMQVRGPSAGATGGVMVGADRETDYKFEVVGSGAMNGIYASGESTFVPNAADQIPVYVSGAASQTANLLEVVEVDGTSVFSVDNTGVALIGGDASKAIQLNAGVGTVSTLYTNNSTLYLGANSNTAVQFVGGSSISFKTAASIFPLSLSNAGAAFPGAGAIFTAGASIHSRPQTGAGHAAIFQGQTAQTADITEWQDISSTVLASVGPEGTFSTASGEIHVYNSGYAIGAADYERLSLHWNSNVAEINTAAGGTGALRTVRLRQSGGNYWADWESAGIKFYGATALNFNVGSAATAFYKNINPDSDGSVSCGVLTNRWSNTYTRDLDVSGVLYASGDPGTAGQVLTSTADGIQWQDVATLSGPSGTASGVAFYGNDGLLTVDDGANFVWDSGSNRLFIGASGLRQTGNTLGTLTVHAQDANNFDAVLDLRTSSNAPILAVKNGNSNTTPVAQITYTGGYISPYNGVLIRRTTGGTNFILQLSDTSNILKFEAESDGRVQLGGPTLGGLDGTLTVYNVNSTTEGIVVHGATSQTANMTTWVDSNDEPLAEIDKDGFLLIHNSGVEWDETDYEALNIGWATGPSLDGSFIEFSPVIGGTGTQRPMHFGQQSALNPKPSFNSTAVRSVSFGAGQYNKIYGQESVVINAINSIANSRRSVLVGGYYSIMGSGINSDDCRNSVILGGYNNKIRNNRDAPAVIGGRYNQIVERNENVSNYNAGGADVVLGGNDNKIYNFGATAGNNSTSNSIIGGNYNRAIQSTASSIVGSTKSRTYECTNSAIIGGYQARAINDNCVAIGSFAGAQILGEVVQGGGNLSGGVYLKVGETDRSSVVLSVKTTDETGTAGFDGYTLMQPHSDSNAYLDILPSSTWTFRAQVSAYNLTDHVAAGYTFEGVVRRDNADSTAIVGVVDSKSWAEGSMTGVVATVTADDTNERLNILVSGLAAKTIHWSAFVDSSRVRGEGFSQFLYNP